MSGGARVFCKGRTTVSDDKREEKLQTGEKSSNAHVGNTEFNPLQQKKPSLSYFLPCAGKYPLMVHCRKLEHTGTGISSIMWKKKKQPLSSRFSTKPF